MNNTNSSGKHTVDGHLWFFEVLCDDGRLREDLVLGQQVVQPHVILC